MEFLKRSVLPAWTLAIAVAIFVGYFAVAAFASTTVSQQPRTDVMTVLDGEVLDSVVVGNHVVVVGTFTQVQDANSSTIVDQAYIAAYNADTGRLVPSFDPVVDDYINSIAAGPGETLFLGGQFDSVNGESHRRVAKISLSGGVFSAFRTSVDATVNVVEVANNKLYFGGRFESVNGEPRLSLAAVDINTGVLDSTTNFDFSFSNQAGGGVAVKWLDISSDGSFMFVSHGARFIDDEIRSGIARFDISRTETTLSDWQTLLYDNERDALGGVIRARRVAISPDDDYVVLVTSGGDRPPAGDTAVRFPTVGGANVAPDWVSRHFDTVLGVAISPNAIFVGGHFQFQEAPGSANPFPGDPSTDYTFSGGQGALALGSEVVQREQLGALDPATGKALGWNPGSDSFFGVQSLTWDDQYGLLVGHDGNRLGGVSDIGRHAIFPIGAPSEPERSEAVELEPGERFGCFAVLDGQSAEVTLLGDLGSSVHVLRNGEWAGSANGSSILINASGSDAISARVRGPNFASPFEDFACTTSVGSHDTTRAVTILSPGVGSIANGAAVTISGTAEATNGVSFVRVTVKREQDQLFLTPDGGWVSEWTPIDVGFDSGVVSAPWSLDVNLDLVGGYEVSARTFDSSGVRGASVTRGFTVGGADNAAPELAIDEPVVVGNEVSVFGSVNDDVGVAGVDVLVENLETNEYFRPDGTVGQAQAFAATLEAPGALSTGWALTLTDVPAGEWAVVVDALDVSNQRDRGKAKFVTVEQVAPAAPVAEPVPSPAPAPAPVPVPVVPSNDAPSLFFDEPTRFIQGVDSLRNTISGYATDDISVAAVEVSVFDYQLRRWLLPDGTYGESPEPFLADLSAPGAASTGWEFEFVAPQRGTYQFVVRAVDSSGQATESSPFSKLRVYPGDGLPLVTVDLAAAGATLSEHIALSGTATDDVGVSRVQIRVRNEATGEYLQTSGELGSNHWLLASVTNPNAPQTSWTYASPDLPAGTWRVWVRSVDSSGQDAAPPVTTTVTIR